MLNLTKFLNDNRIIRAAIHNDTVLFVSVDIVKALKCKYASSSVRNYCENIEMHYVVTDNKTTKYAMMIPLNDVKKLYGASKLTEAQLKLFDEWALDIQQLLDENYKDNSITIEESLRDQIRKLNQIVINKDKQINELTDENEFLVDHNYSLRDEIKVLDDKNDDLQFNVEKLTNLLDKTKKALTICKSELSDTLKCLCFTKNELKECERNIFKVEHNLNDK